MEFRIWKFENLKNLWKNWKIEKLKNWIFFEIQKSTFKIFLKNLKNLKNSKIEKFKIQKKMRNWKFKNSIFKKNKEFNACAWMCGFCFVAVRSGRMGRDNPTGCTRLRGECHPWERPCRLDRASSSKSKCGSSLDLQRARLLRQSNHPEHDLCRHNRQRFLPGKLYVFSFSSFSFFKKRPINKSMKKYFSKLTPLTYKHMNFST